MVTEDAVGHPIQAWMVSQRECLEGTLVAVLNPNHEVLVHAPTSLGPTAVLAAGGDRVISGPL
jgi:hypothetical protein